MKKLDKQSFATKVASLDKAISVQGKVYHSIRVTGEKVRFIRSGKVKEESINLIQLYELYLKVSYPTNQEARAYISGRVQSPAVSIINAIGNDSNLSSTNALPHEVIKSIPSEKRTSKQKEKTEKDEMKFFLALNEVLGKECLLSKCIQKPISSSEVFLSDNFRDYAFPESIKNNFERLLEALISNYSFSSKSISHFIDGLLQDHPFLGSRIVEFDEEQHFTPALKDALIIQNELAGNIFSNYYLNILDDTEYLNEVIKKMRIRKRFEKYPISFIDFTSQIQNEKVSGYIEPKENGFPCLGGRVAQRAYYDCLRNAAHLSPKNLSLKPILRFPKKFFEDASGKRFGTIGKEQLMELIQLYLDKIYGYDLKTTK